MWWAYISTRRPQRRCCVSMRSRRCTPWIAPSPCCRCGRVFPRGRPTTTSPRHDESVYRAQRLGQDGPDAVRAAETPHRVLGVSESAGSGGSQAARGASASRPLWHSHAPHGRHMVRRAPSLSPPLCPDECVVAEPGRARVRRHYAQADSPRHVPLEWASSRLTVRECQAIITDCRPLTYGER